MNANYDLVVTPREKFKIATEDSADLGSPALAAAFGGKAQLANSTPSFGHGANGAAQYFGTSYADFVIGNFMTEAIYPKLARKQGGTV